MLGWSYRPARLLKSIGRPLGLSAKNRLRVLLYHDIPPEDLDAFAAQLRWLSHDWTFVPPERFAAMVTGDEPMRGSNLMLTFDDGFVSNRDAAERVLNRMGIRALFFVVSDFVALTDRDEARRFVDRQIFPYPEVSWARRFNMGWSDLEALLEQGHTIGGHTATHARLSAVTAEHDLEREIAGSADAVSRRLGVPIEHFAFTFGDLASFSASALAVARRRFRFVYSGLRGDNARDVPAFALRRDSTRPRDSLASMGAFLEGVADVYYARSRARLEGRS